MNNYFYNQFKRLFDLSIIHDESCDVLNRQFEWVETNSEKRIFEELIHTTHMNLQRVRKQLIDNLREKLMIRIRRKTGIDMQYEWLNHIAYIDDDGKQWNLYGLHLQKQVTRGQKGVIIILMRVLTKNPTIHVNLQIELSESGDDSAALYYDFEFASWRQTYTLS